MQSLYKQFLLLTTKNLILLKRNKLWTFFEIVLPIVLVAPIIYFVVKNADISHTKEKVFDPVSVTGDFNDIDRSVGYSSRIKQRWCLLTDRDLKIAYSTVAGIPKEVPSKIMRKLAERYSIEGRYKMQEVYAATPQAMEDILRADLKNETANGCLIRNFVGGIVFDRVDFTTSTFDYRIRLPNDKDISWHMKDNWRGGNPYAGIADYNAIPSEPPYWSYAFLTFQKALNDIIMQNISSEVEIEDPQIILNRIPEPPFNESSIQKFLVFLPALWAFFIFPTVIHAAREMAAEMESGVKSFMQVMGLSSPVFYASHIFMAWLKTLLVCLLCALPLAIKMLYINPVVFVLTAILYALGTVTFAALCASLLKSANSVLKLSIVLWFVSLGITRILTATRDRVWYCTLCSLNINHAFSLAIEIMADYCNRERDLTVVRLFEFSTISFSLGQAIVMIIIDIIWMGALTLLIDWLKTGSDGWCWGIGKDEGPQALNVSPENHLGAGYDEVDYARQNSASDIIVHELTKIWPDSGEIAVDKLNLNAYRGQVTVLLGHNGAGKSTTFSIICGLVQPTSGSVHSDVSGTSIGYCPQANALFEKLTVEEHLWFFHELKGAITDYREETKETLDHLKLTDKNKELSMNLSGGMKRKLCVGLAVIGRSQVVLLDEPTAGMDPGARRDVEKMLEEYKGNRTILLTTHYMDEAELLGDWVYIMCKGRAVTNGTPDFLKKKFGTGFVLTASVEEKGSPEKVAKRLVEIAQDKLGMSSKEDGEPSISVGKVHGRQVEIILPEDKKKIFGKLFEYLEREKWNLSVDSFGISLSTLEQVFLEVGERLDDGSGYGRDRRSGSRSQSVRSAAGVNIDPTSEEAGDGPIGFNDRRLTGPALWLSQFTALLYKRVMYTRRNWQQLISQLVVPILLLLLITYATQMSRSIATNENRSLSFSAIGPLKVPLQVLGSQTELGEAFKSVVKEQPDFELLEISASEDFKKKIFEVPKDLPALGIGAIVRRNETVVLFNGVGFHTTVTAMNLAANARLRQKAGRGSITPSIHVYDAKSADSPASKVVNSQMADMVLAPLLIIVFALVTSTFSMFLVEERVCRFSHQQRLTPTSPLLFWLASFTYDILIYVAACLIFGLIFVASGFMKGMMGYVILLWALYLWSCGPFIYAVSFLFSSPSKANTFLVIWQIVTSLMALFCVMIIGLLIPSINADYLTTAFMFALPPYAMGAGMMTIAQRSIAPEFMMEMMGGNGNMMEWNALGRPVHMMALFGIVSIIGFFVLQCRCVHKLFSQLWNYSMRKDYYKRISTYNKAPTPESTNSAKTYEIYRKKDLKKNGKSLDTVKSLRKRKSRSGMKVDDEGSSDERMKEKDTSMNQQMPSDSEVDDDEVKTVYGEEDFTLPVGLRPPPLVCEMESEEKVGIVGKETDVPIGELIEFDEDPFIFDEDPVKTDNIVGSFGNETLLNILTESSTSLTSKKSEEKGGNGKETDVPIGELIELDEDPSDVDEDEDPVKTDNIVGSFGNETLLNILTESSTSLTSKKSEEKGGNGKETDVPIGELIELDEDPSDVDEDEDPVKTDDIVGSFGNEALLKILTESSTSSTSKKSEDPAHDYVMKMNDDGAMSKEELRRKSQPFYTDTPSADTDEDVREEYRTVKNEEEGTNFAVKVLELYKCYSGYPAVKNLTFAVENRQCFGLLGVNGAGKTSTFDVLTGVNFATAGQVEIGGRSVEEKIPIGYCPQFDAMLVDLTGMEILFIMASLHGYAHPRVKAREILNAVGMGEHGEKQIRHCSGGQRRKISVAIALLAKTRVVILDEPTAGIDPKARRDIWTQLSEVRDLPDSALLLTSHSMDECEALCTKIGIINKGQMAAIGTSQHLKSKYGNSYILTLILSLDEVEKATEEADSEIKSVNDVYRGDANTKQRTDQIHVIQMKKERKITHAIMNAMDTVNTEVTKEFPEARLKTTGASRTVKWQIPRKTSDRWSQMWNRVQELSERIGAKDFCLTQSSLEETFLRLAMENDEEEESTRDKRHRHPGGGGGAAPLAQSERFTTSVDSPDV